MIELAALLREQRLEQRVFERGKIDRVEIALCDIGIDLERSILEAGRLAAVGAEEFMHRLIGIDRRDRQQEIEAAGDPVELAIGFHRRCKDGAAPKRAVMARRPVLPVRGEAARRAEQRVARRQ